MTSYPITFQSDANALTVVIDNLLEGCWPRYRSSTLTHILQDSLGGNCRTTLILTV